MDKKDLSNFLINTPRNSVLDFHYRWR